MVSAKLVLAICALGAVISYCEALECGAGDLSLEFRGYRTSCIRLQKGTKTYQQAVDFCKAAGGELATFSHKRAADKYREYIQGMKIPEGVWLGGKQDASKVFRWEATSGRRVESCYIWAKGEPNGSGTCLQMWAGRQHKFDDTPCSRVKRFGCAFY